MMRGAKLFSFLKSIPGFRRVAGLRSRLGITALCIGIFLLLRILNPLPAESFRDSSIGKLIDVVTEVRGQGEGATKTKVVVVDIDEATIAKYGRWPLPRRDLAALLDAVMAGNPASVGFAYVFLPAGGDAAGDRRLALSLQDDRVVLGMAQFRSRQSRDVGGISRAAVRASNTDALGAIPDLGRLTPIPATLRDAGNRVGLLSIQLSHEGIPRRLPTLARHQGGLIPSLPLEMLRVASGKKAILVSGGASGVRNVSVGDRVIKTDPNGMIWFGLGQRDQIHHVSALDILEGRADPATFRARHILIGTTAAGLSAEHVAADGGLLPGLDALGYSLSALLVGKTYYYPTASMVLEILIALLLAALAYVTDRVFNARAFLGTGAAAFFLLWGGVVLVLTRSGQILDPGLLSLFAGFLYGALMLNNYRLGREEARGAVVEKEREVSTLREDSARVSVAAANPRLSIALSHELRQPLAAARNYLGAIQRLAGRSQTGDVDRLSSYVDEANRQISSMTEIMNELSEIVRGDLTLQTADDLGALVLEAATATLSSVDDPCVRLVPEIPGNLPPVLLNRRQIQLVVSNLTRNAVGAPRKAQELVLVLKARVLDREWVEVSLSDNASGIPDSLRDRIFLRFESSKSIGSGIGLPFCRDIIQAHGGQIRFETSPGTGTTFFFTLRRADQPSGAVPS